GGDRTGCRDPHPPARDLHRHREDPGLRRSRRGPGRRRGTVGVSRSRNGELPDRGARARCAVVQLPQARGHRDDRGPRDEDRERARRDSQLREEVDRGSQGNARRARPQPPRRGITMRHQRAGKKLGRDSAHRRSLYANLAGALIEHGRIKTTEAKAKAVKPLAEQMITLGRRGDLAARRQAISTLRSKGIVHQLFADVAPRFADRPGGYTRIVKLGPRHGDAADMVYLELVDYEPAGAASGPTQRG